MNRLMEAMRGNSDLTSTAINPDRPVVLPPTPASAGTNPQPLPDWCTALFIMHGIKARWVINYYQVSNMAGAESGVNDHPTFEQVDAVIKDLARRTAKRT